METLDRTRRMVLTGAILSAMLGTGRSVVAEVTISAPSTVLRYTVAEFVVTVDPPTAANPFTDTELTGRFMLPDRSPVVVPGFADSDDGSTFRLRFCPDRAGAYAFEIRLHGPGTDRTFKGVLRCEPSDHSGPVIVNPKKPRHCMYAGSGKPFYHLGYTAYHLLDPSNDDTRIEALIDYCAREHFNKIRFLLTGYPRDTDSRAASQPSEYGVADPKRLPNYGAPPGRVNPLPAWAGIPHHYDFTRFNVAHWQRADRTVHRMAERGIVATCIFTIEKQDLPTEYGRLTDAEYRLYRYAVARLAAFDNVWWDLGNEHNEYRDKAWGNTMGTFVKQTDPFHRLTSAHGYAEFVYREAAWSDFVITQQYGEPRTVHDWVLKYRSTPKPYVNEEYGYEGGRDQPGHEQNADRVRRAHWSIAMAGGYATYGDWSRGVAHFYAGQPGPGQAARQLKHLRTFFEPLPFSEMEPDDSVTSRGFGLARPGEVHVIYLPDGGETELRLPGPGTKRWTGRWFDPRTGDWREGPNVNGGEHRVAAPDQADWALLLRSQ